MKLPELYGPDCIVNVHLQNEVIEVYGGSPVDVLRLGLAHLVDSSALADGPRKTGVVDTLFHVLDSAVWFGVLAVDGLAAGESGTIVPDLPKVYTAESRPIDFLFPASLVQEVSSMTMAHFQKLYQRPIEQPVDLTMFLARWLQKREEREDLRVYARAHPDMFVSALQNIQLFSVGRFDSSNGEFPYFPSTTSFMLGFGWFLLDNLEWAWPKVLVTASIEHFEKHARDLALMRRLLGRGVFTKTRSLFQEVQ